VLEVEMKFPVADFAALERRLAEWGARADAPRTDADHYVNAPDRDFGRTDEALRLRRTGSANCVTYKGPKRDAQTKTRTEIEVPLADGDAAADGFLRILTHLGYGLVAVVRKRRRIFHLEWASFPLEVCLDEVEGLGPFVELETLTPEDRLDEARTVVLRLAAALGLTASERRSYLELLLAKASRNERA
jgi:adenylate cyclase class 2